MASPKWGAAAPRRPSDRVSDRTGPDQRGAGERAMTFCAPGNAPLDALGAVLATGRQVRVKQNLPNPATGRKVPPSQATAPPICRLVLFSPEDIWPTELVRSPHIFDGGFAVQRRPVGRPPVTRRQSYAAGPSSRSSVALRYPPLARDQWLATNSVESSACRNRFGWLAIASPRISGPQGV